MISFPSFKIERDHAWNWILKLIAYPYLTALFAKFINWPPKIKIFIFLSSLNWIMQNKLFKNWILSSKKQQQYQKHKKSINQAFIFKDKTTTTSSLSHTLFFQENVNIRFIICRLIWHQQANICIFNKVTNIFINQYANT